MTAETAIQTTAPESVEVHGSQNRRTNWTYRPNVDIFNTADELLLLADMPGSVPDHIDVSLESGILTVQAEVVNRNHGRARNLAHEYGVGGFHRRFEIDEDIDHEGVAAEYDEGVLTVHLPKAQQARPRRIPVST